MKATAPIKHVPENVQNCYFLEVERRSIIETMQAMKRINSEKIQSILMKSLKKVTAAERDGLEQIAAIKDETVKKMVTLHFLECKSFENIGALMNYSADGVRVKIRNYYKKKR